jgi:hypothetical protein
MHTMNKPPVLTHEWLQRILQDVRYRDWKFTSRQVEGGFLLWVSFRADCESWTGRKWYISQYATRSEIVQTCLKAVLTAEEHEAREKFLYQGHAVFGPHLHVGQLLTISEEFDARPSPPEVSHG